MKHFRKQIPLPRFRRFELKSFVLTYFNKIGSLVNTLESPMSKANKSETGTNFRISIQKNRTGQLLPVFYLKHIY